MERTPSLHFEHRRFEAFGHWRLSWWVQGERGAVEVQAIDYGKDRGTKFFDDRFSGGVEVHYAQCPDYMRGDAPHHGRCKCLQESPCWHDGSSLAFDSYRQIVANDSHELIFAALRREYMDRFHGGEDDD